MQVGEQHQVVTKIAVLGFDRFLHLEHHVTGGPGGCGVGADRGAGGDVGGIRDRRAVARTGLHDHLVAVGDQFVHTRGGDGDAVFVVLDFGGNGNLHGFSVLAKTEDFAPLRGQIPRIS